jgi:hypothetical protein
MVEFICLVAGAVICFSNSTVTIQNQDPWVGLVGQISAVVIGGIIGGVITLIAQNRSFRIQDRTNLMNLRTAAYLDLLAIIFTDEKTDKLDTGKFHSALARAATYGSPEIKQLLYPIMITDFRSAETYRNSFSGVKDTILREVKNDLGFKCNNNE